MNKQNITIAALVVLAMLVVVTPWVGTQHVLADKHKHHHSSDIVVDDGDDIPGNSNTNDSPIYKAAHDLGNALKDAVNGLDDAITGAR
jgi:hypothetical protein